MKITLTPQARPQKLATVLLTSIAALNTKDTLSTVELPITLKLEATIPLNLRVL
jgi:hypothetical protein